MENALPPSLLLSIAQWFSTLWEEVLTGEKASQA